MREITLEERYLLSCFTSTSKTDLLAEMQDKMRYLEPEMRKLVKQVRERILKMTDEELNSIILSGAD